MKRPYLGIFVIAGIGAVAVAAGGYRKYKVKTFEAERELNAARIQKEYLERVGWIRSNPDERTYREEVRPFLRGYFQEIAAHNKRFHGNPNFDDYLLELKKRPNSSVEQLADKRAYYEYTKKVFDELKGGLYAPMWSGTDKGMRLDVHSAAIEKIDGKPRVRIDLVLWGAQRELREESTSAGGIVVGARKRMLTSASFTMSWRLLDSQGRLIGELNAAGDPSMKVDFPERFVQEFPPQMVLGYYPVDRIPAEVKKIEMIFTVASRSPFGGEALGSYRWQLEAPADWKLAPGEKWEGAEESVRSPEEIDPNIAATQVRKKATLTQAP
jgi:hypothetical protein